MPPRVVLDCMLFLQAITNERGPAFKCFLLAEQRRITLVVSPAVLSEVQNVLNRPLLQAKFPVLTPQRVEAFLTKFKAVASLTTDPPNFFRLPRDPKDQPYTDLAIFAGATHLVTWNDRHLTYLMRKDTPEGIQFCDRFPGITILSPTDFLEIMRRDHLA